MPTSTFFTYDKLSRITGVTPQSGQALSYTYDNLNRLTNIQSGTNNFAYGYTGADPLVQTLSRPGGAQTIYEYNDPLKRLTALINNDASSQLVNRFDYAYSDASHPDQRSSETVTNGASFTFPQNELTRYEHNSLNQLIRTTAPEKLFTYDDAGNMTKGYTPDGYQFTSTYDAENRLASIEYTDSGSTVHKAEYVYSGSGFLAQIKKYENSNPVGDIRIMRSGYLAIQERDATNQVVREYTWGLNMGGGIGGLLNIRQGGNDYKYLYDGKGNVNALLNTSQQVAASYRYDSFGNLMAKTGTLDQPFGFSTKRYDAGTGLSYYGYRFYAPTIGKWLTRDPLGEAGGINLYGFCLNDPVNWVDLWGLAPGDLFDTLDAAAIDAIDFTMGVSKKDQKEYGGFLYKTPDGKFSYTEAVKGKENEMDVGKFNKPPEDNCEAGIYHTHPGRGDNVKWFSTFDYLISSSYRVPIYLGTEFQYIGKWDPNKAKEYVIRKGLPQR